MRFSREYLTQYFHMKLQFLKRPRILVPFLCIQLTGIAMYYFAYRTSIADPTLFISIFGRIDIKILILLGLCIQLFQSRIAAAAALFYSAINMLYILSTSYQIVNSYIIVLDAAAALILCTYYKAARENDLRSSQTGE